MSHLPMSDAPSSLRRRPSLLAGGNMKHSDVPRLKNGHDSFPETIMFPFREHPVVQLHYNV